MTTALTAALALAGCGGASAPLPAPAGPTAGASDPAGTATAVAAAEVPMPAQVEYAPRGAAPPPGWEGRTWADMLAEARGQTVVWHLWGGDERLNRWTSDWVADLARNRYEIELEIVPVADTADVVAQLVGDAAAGVAAGGVDLMWINGENFRALRSADLLYGPWTGFVPSAAYVDLDDPRLAFDLGTPVAGYELPWGRAQLVLVRDAAHVPEAPATLAELLDLAEALPGRFTYPAPPDFTGSAFVRLACRATAGGAEVDALLAAPVTAAALAVVGPPCWSRLRGLAPSLWRGGATYPSTLTQLDDLFADGEVWFTLNYNPTAADRQIAAGRFPETARTSVFAEGTLANTHYLAIPKAAANKAAAMVLANFLLSPEAQFAKAVDDNWGDLPVVDPARIPESWRAAIAGLERGPAAVPLSTLEASAVREPDASWIEALEAGWIAEVLER